MLLAQQYTKKQSDLETWLSDDLINPVKSETVTKKFIIEFHNYADDDQLKLFAKIYYSDGTNVQHLDFWNPPNDIPPFTNRDHYVTVSRWVYLKDPKWDPGEPKTVLLEVYLWRN